MKNQIMSCEFNIDTACVEVKLTDGSMVSIDCIAVENEYANNMYETSELDYLIYNEPIVTSDYCSAARRKNICKITQIIPRYQI